MGRCSVAWVACALGACSFSGTGKGGPGNDVDSGVPDAPEQCTPNAIECAGPNTLRECHADGMGVDDTDCPAGCIDTPEPHCGSFTPSNGVAFTEATAEVDTVDTDWIFDTDTGRIVDGADNEIRAAGTGIDATTGIGYTQIEQGTDPGIGVFEMASLNVAADTTLRGRGVRSLAIAVSGPITVAGVIDVRGGADACFAGGPVTGQRCAGPGGFSGGASMADGEGATFGAAGENNSGESGGGGGALGGDGGSGGGADSSNGGAGGTAGTPNSPSPLVGGSGGGGGGTETSDVCQPFNPPFDGGPGGGGGGAAQLVSLESITFVAGASCGVNAGGGGGQSGDCSAGGGGGGSGGAILLEAPAIDLPATCAIAANGGGGGAGSFLGFDVGDDGRLGVDRARGANNTVNSGGDGGDGATLNDTVQTGDNDNGQAGGGGGGLGVIAVHSAAGKRALDGDVSPAATAEDLTIE